VYAERRQGGSPAAVDAALRAIDDLDAEHAASAPAPATGQPGGPAPTTDASGTPAATPEGGFTL
jgi:hypothetical protein